MMCNQLKPVLCDTESEINDHSQTPSLNQRIFKQSDAVIVPNFSDKHLVSSSDNINTNTNANTAYHCISTKNDKIMSTQVCKPETIDNIIRKEEIRNAKPKFTARPSFFPI